MQAATRTLPASVQQALSTKPPLRRAARIILTGCPGAGKGTQSARLLRAYPSLLHISSGDILRDNVRRGTSIGIQAESLMNSGHLLPDDLIIKLILSSLPKDITTSYIIDGFPRTRVQAEAMSKEGIDINFVVNLDVPHSVILERICNRLIHAPSGRVYNTSFSPPKVAGVDDVTGEPLIRRVDDDPETFKVRLKKYDETTSPLLDFYAKKGVLWTVSGNTSDEITPRLVEEIRFRFG